MGIEISNPGSHFEIRGNRLFGGGFAAIGISVHLEPPLLSHLDFKLADNTIANFRRRRHSVIDNQLRGAVRGGSHSWQQYLRRRARGGHPLRHQLPQAWQRVLLRWVLGAVVSGNVLDTLFTKIDRDPATVPFIAVNGNLGDCSLRAPVLPRALWRRPSEVSSRAPTRE